MICAVFGLAAVVWEPRGQGVISVRPEAAFYSVAPGETVALRLMIDPVPAAGLFSYGVMVRFDPEGLRLAANGVVVPPPLGFNGVSGSGPIILVGGDFAGVKGTIDLSSGSFQAYENPLLVTLFMEALDKLGSAQDVTLELFRTLGPTESVFVDGAGGVLDDRLAFGSATVVIVPEPRSVFLWFSFVLLAGVCGWVERRPA